MKKKLIFAAVAALLPLVSCRVEQPEQESGIEITEDSETVCPTIFKATIAGSTKTDVNLDNGKVTWLPNGCEEITVTDASGASAIYDFTGYYDYEETVAMFLLKPGETPLGEGPYSAKYGTEPALEQTFIPNGADREYPYKVRLYMTAPATSNGLFEFTVQCGLLRLILTQKGRSISRVEVTGTPAGGSETTYTLICDTAQSIDSARDFCIALPEGEYSRIVITDSRGGVCTKTVKSAPLSILKNHIKPVTFTSLSFTPKSACYPLNEDAGEYGEDERPDVSRDIWGIQW